MTYKEFYELNEHLKKVMRKIHKDRMFAIRDYKAVVTDLVERNVTDDFTKESMRMIQFVANY